MAQLIVRNLDDDVKAKLQRRAKRHGHSTEEEVRDILRNAVKEETGTQPGLGSRMAALFKDIGLATGGNSGAAGLSGQSNRLRSSDHPRHECDFGRHAWTGPIRP